MRPLTAAVATGHRAPTTNLKPREGTRLRALFDTFMAAKGKPLHLVADHYPSMAIDQLRNFYGLDIRCLRRGHNARPPTWVLAGEWFGDTYIDYIAERLTND